MNETTNSQETITDEALAQDAAQIKAEFERTQRFNPEPIVQFYVNAARKLTQKEGVEFYGGYINPASIPRYVPDGAVVAVETTPGVESSMCDVMIGNSADDRAVNLSVSPDSVVISTRMVSNTQRSVLLTIDRGDRTSGHVGRSSEAGLEEYSYLTDEGTLRQPTTANLMNAEEALSSLGWIAQKIAAMPDGEPTILGSAGSRRKLVFDPAVESEFVNKS